MSHVSRLVLLVIGTALLAACSTTDSVTRKSPEEHQRVADELAAKGRYEDAIAQWKKVKESYKSPALTALAEINIADLHFANKSWIEAAASYEDFRKLHPTNPKAPYALYRAGLSYYNQIESIDTDQTPVKNTVNTLDAFLKYYPQSEYGADAKAKLADCRQKMAAYELYVGRFYYRTEKYVSAIGRLEGLLKNYPAAKGTDEALYLLGASYRETGETDKSKAALTRVVAEYPVSPFAKDAGKLLKK